MNHEDDEGVGLTVKGVIAGSIAVNSEKLGLQPSTCFDVGEIVYAALKRMLGEDHALVMENDELKTTPLPLKNEPLT